MGYKHLQLENVPEVLKTKPKLVTCVAFFTAILMIITSAISVGILIGYTYCYIEHRTGYKTIDNITANFQVVRMPTNDVRFPNRTINGALMSSVLVSRILNVGQAFVDEEMPYLPWTNDESYLHLFTK